MFTNIKVVAMLLFAMNCAAQSASTAGDNWYSYGGDPGGTHYSSLRQITKANVKGLKEVWRFETPDAGSLETTPLIVRRHHVRGDAAPEGDRA